jgi:hypothetical protein
MRMLVLDIDSSMRSFEQRCRFEELLSDLPGECACKHPGGAKEEGEGRAAPEGDSLGALVAGHGHGLAIGRRFSQSALIG